MESRAPLRLCDPGIYSIYNLNDTIDLPPIPTGRSDFPEYFSDLIARVDALTLRLRLERIKNEQAGKGPTLRLTPDTRKALQFHIDKMQQLIAEVELPPAKREAIAQKLTALALEINTDRTKWESWMSLAIEIADTAEKIEKKIDPIQKVLNAIFKRLGKAKEEAPQLPRPEKPKQIEGPKKSKGSAELDDDIPF